MLEGSVFNFRKRAGFFITILMVKLMLTESESGCEKGDRQKRIWCPAKTARTIFFPFPFSFQYFYTTELILIIQFMDTTFK